MAQLKRYQLAQELALERKLFQLDAQERLLHFSVYTKPDYHVGWHHRIMCSALDDFAAKKIKRLMIFMPPRHGKSELVSRRLPAHIFGQKPNAQIIATSYSASLASRMNRDVQKIMDDQSYKELFPKTKLGGKKEGSKIQATRTTSFFEITGHSGLYRSAGVGGGIVGMGADYIIIDDPIKNQEEADSDIYRQRVWDWYTSTLYTRLEKDAGLLITLTRWHEDDLAGRLIQMMKTAPDADQWQIINFPAIREDMETEQDPRKIGEALWSEKYDVPALKSIHLSVGSRTWNAQYQQRPAAQEGEIIKREWWKFVKEMPTEFDCIIDTWDLTFKESSNSDFVSGLIIGKKGAHKYLLGSIHERMSFTKTIEKMLWVRKTWPQINRTYVEEAANGAALLDTLRPKISGLIGVKPQGSKIARANAIAPQAEAGNLWLLGESHSQCPLWVQEFIEEWSVFPNGRNDDQVDAYTQGISKLNDMGSTDWLPVSLTMANKFA